MPRGALAVRAWERRGRERGRVGGATRVRLIDRVPAQYLNPRALTGGPDMTDAEEWKVSLPSGGTAPRGGQ